MNEPVITNGKIGSVSDTVKMYVDPDNADHLLTEEQYNSRYIPPSNELHEEIELPPLPQSVLMRMRINNNSGCYLEATQEALYGRERQLKSSLAANREQKAEIERLHQKDMTYYYGVMAHEQYRKDVAEQNARYEGCIDSLQRQVDSQLASLRASVGEKWIDVKQELPPENQYVLAANTFNNRSDLITQHVVFWEADRDWFWFNEDARWGRAAFGFWMPLPAPPTLPGEEK